MFKHKKLILILLTNWLFLIDSVHGDCVLEKARKNVPLYMRDYGTKTIVVQSSTDDVTLANNEKIRGYCSANFSTFVTNEDPLREERFEGISVLEIICQDGVIRVRSPGAIDDYLALQITYPSSPLWCSEPTWNLFETKRKLSNCKNHISYAFGALTTKEPIILAGTCYDLDNLEMQYVNYIVKEKTNLLTHQERVYPEELSLEALGKPIGNIKNLIKVMNSSEFQAGLSYKAISNIWLKFANYQYDSLIQGNQFCYELRELNDMFDIVWWDNLRLGNWRQFIALLEDRSMTMTYSIYAGTSGEVRIPTAKTKTREVLIINSHCDDCNPKSSHFDRPRRTIPEYVWTYVRLLTHDVQNAEEFVVIGYNSPFIGYFTRNETIFCDDMCEEIEWLEPIERTRMVPTLGVIFCCRPEQVQHHLRGFPRIRGNTTMKLTLKEDLSSELF